MSRGRVLLVEDSADDEALLLRALRTGGLAAEVDVARGGQEALGRLLGTEARADGDLPLVVLLDLKLGAVDGFTVLQEVRSNPRTQLVPVVVTSASAQDEDVERAYSLGANGYVQKSVDFDRFAYDVQVAAAYWMRVNVPPRSRPAPISRPRQRDGVGASDQFRLAVEAAPTGMLMIDERGRIALVNAQIERLFGYTRHELLGKPVEMLVPERFRRAHPGLGAGFFGEPKFRAMGAGRDLYGVHKNGTEVPIEIGLNPLRTPTGDFVLSSVVDITERKRAEKALRASEEQLRALNSKFEERVHARTTDLTAMLREREVLLQEVHHRVKNNLQVISNLINMQVRKLEDGASRDALEECQTRVQAIALIHETLYQSKDYGRVPFPAYARSLAGSVFHAAGRSPARVALEMDIEDVAIAVDKAIPCGLVLNELITNALKHAFPGGRGGTIRVELRRVEGPALRLVVTDDGVGMPHDFDIQQSESLGHQLITTLAEQLDGRLTIENEGGAKFTLTFPGSA